VERPSPLGVDERGLGTLNQNLGEQVLRRRAIPTVKRLGDSIHRAGHVEIGVRNRCAARSNQGQDEEGETDDRTHPPGPSAVTPVGLVTLVIAIGATSDELDVLRSEAGTLKQEPVCLPQVDMGSAPLPGRSADLLVRQAQAPQAPDHLGADLEAARPYCGTDRGVQTLARDAEFPLSDLDGDGCDASDRSAPTRVHSRNSGQAWVIEQNRDAVRHSHRDVETRPPRPESITFCRGDRQKRSGRR
jgi:hypothetical protein